MVSTSIAPDQTTRRKAYALIKRLISPTVCVRFILHTSLVPSASLICTLVVGASWSTSNLVVRLSLSPEEEGPGALELAPADATIVPLTGNVPGIMLALLLLAAADRASPGTGEPRR